ncbi:MAG TPA: MFS transporter [Candidatus Eremiobacteraceae bacterium]|nr:MFS transporter [Candidatus Eremiobacteraceae bacterium]
MSVSTAAGTTSQESSSGTWVLVATILGSTMVFIDGTVVNVALPVMQRDLHASMADIQWVVEAYALFLSSLILVGGALGDRYGRKLMFAIGVAGFVISSIACGFAHGIAFIAVARALQGASSALMTPESLAILSAFFNGEKRARAIGIWSSATASTAAIGPALGGWLVDHGGWPWIFFINVPIGVAVLALALVHVPESRDPTCAPLDWTGATLGTAGLGAVVYGLILAGTTGESTTKALAWTIGGCVILLAFILAEKRSTAPMMPLEIFKSPVFAGANVLTFLLYGALAEVIYFVSFDMIQVDRYTPTLAGLAMLPFIVLIVMLSRWAGGLVASLGTRPLLVAGPAITALGMALFAVPDVGGSYWTTFFPAFVTLGIGMGVTVAPLTAAVMDAVDERRLGLASAVNNAVSRTGGLIAVAAMSAIVVAIYGAQFDRSLAALRGSHWPGTVIQEARSSRDAMAAAPIPRDAHGTMAGVIRQAMNRSFVDAFRVAALCGAGMAAASSVIALFTIGGIRKTEKVS